MICSLSLTKPGCIVGDSCSSLVHLIHITEKSKKAEFKRNGLHCLKEGISQERGASSLFDGVLVTFLCCELWPCRQAHLSVAWEASGESSLCVTWLLASCFFLCGVHPATRKSVLCTELKVISLGYPDIRTQRGTGFLRTRSCVLEDSIVFKYLDVASGVPSEDTVFSTGTETPLCTQGDLQLFTT